jgi:two-component system phosphate regulon response regulator OmpR
LDVMMPGETGLAFATRSSALPPTLMLTALNESEDRVAGLESGVSDYLAKPFAPKELLLRLGNMLRQRVKENAATVVAFGPYRFTEETGQLFHDGDAVYLTGSEKTCLQALAQQTRQPMSRAALAEIIGDVSNERSVDVLVNRLRKKIEPNPAKPIYIQTVRHAGYALMAERV